ncbi:MAG: hypothetical protein M1818_008391 [Claussenomyces sp. TS43310]|nr:MAG: hypothetical protein M1818_008391 [Claussenomyces sp. TS43310]
MTAHQKVSLEGRNVEFFGYQAFAVYWMVTWSLETDLDGGFLADDMGLGKTVMMLALMVVQNWLHVAEQEVRDSREGDDLQQRARHLAAKAQTWTQSPEAVCPSNPFPVACPCVHLRSINGKPNYGRLRNCFYSVGQQLMRQDWLYYALYAALCPDSQWRLVTYSTRTTPSRL